MTGRKPERWTAEELAWLLSPEGRQAQDDIRGLGDTPPPPSPEAQEPPRSAEQPRRRVIVPKPDPVAQKRLLELCATGVPFKAIADVVGVHPAKLALLRDGVTHVDCDLTNITIERIGTRMMPVRKKAE